MCSGVLPYSQLTEGVQQQGGGVERRKCGGAKDENRLLKEPGDTSCFPADQLGVRILTGPIRTLRGDRGRSNSWRTVSLLPQICKW